MQRGAIRKEGVGMKTEGNFIGPLTLDRAVTRTRDWREIKNLREGKRCIGQQERS